MDKTFYKIFFIFLIFILCYFLSINFYATLHEEVHKINCEWHGGKAYVEIKLFGINGGNTVCNNEDIGYKVSEREKLDIINEIVGYHIYAFLFALFCCTGVIIITIILR